MNTEDAYRRYRLALIKYIARRISSSQSAEDIAQDMFLRFMQSRPLSDVREPYAYLSTIASHLIYDRSMRERREAVVFDSSLFESMAERHAEISTDDVVERLDAQQRISGTLSRLRPLLADIVLLRHGAGLSLTEIADECGLSPHSSKKYLFLALSACRAEASANET
jgi:RNA polymerase sigma-70 factor (ECF subfamily)